MAQSMTLRIGIEPYTAVKEYTLAIAQGQRRRKADDPKIWFNSIESLAHVLSEDNRGLLNLIAASRPESLAQLANLSGRAKSNLSRTLKTMAHYGLVELATDEKGMLVPTVPYDRIILDLRLASAQAPKRAKAVKKVRAGTSSGGGPTKRHRSSKASLG